MKKEAREGYKMTELGEIPNEWSIKKIGDLIHYMKSGLSRNLKEDDIGIPCIRSNNIINSKICGDELKYWYLEDDKGANIRDYILNDGDILINFINSMSQIGKGCIYKDIGRPAIYTTNIFRMQMEKKVMNNLYFNYFIQTEFYKKEIVLITKPAINQASFTTGDFKNIKLVVPTIKEQEKIVEILSTVDEQIENTEKLIQKNQELKKGLMQQLLTKGIGHTEFKKTELGEIPKAWEIKKIEEICEILDSKRVPLNGKQRLKMQGDIPYYGANAIVDYINDYIFDDELILIAEDGGNFGEFREKPIAFYVKGKCWVNNHAHVLKAVECENSKWIFYNLVHKDITEIVQGGTRAKLNQKDLRNIKIPFPNLDEQEKIALILSSMDKKIEQYKYKKEKLEELKKGLMKQLLNGNIRVI
ncbi:restriction endonuclease subunit S [Clostridium perfringens]|uniref:restriction endonuclease subunit S n=1 Tax=Clostridium perfringens TaxID=1502 RepID=UPI000F53D96C|nr:restriction endonuclease subunit S [Clostridium perfringens]MDK3223295.1 restriction endonuclease subunit S [Clostridium perfringens]MDM0807199.1 restriction endonuclease subunit S [Clostridium perfringens]RQN16900.1 restriction endonuclease subunit S [Clostridium perfringens]